ncbi:uncharacterized protein TNCV_1182591 [Trichonephila clavipes]|nr:uncharacterized protein TNCV_1182591 [Trichonephila clavipes]
MPINVQWLQALATDTLSSYTHDYPTLPASVAEAIYPIYVDLSNVKLLERMFNEGTKSLLHFMSALELSLGNTAHAYVDKEDAERKGACEKEEWLNDNTSWNYYKLPILQKVPLMALE